VPDVLNADGKIEQDGEERRLLAVASPYANLSQTSTYLNVTRIGLHESMRRLDESASRGKAVATETQTDPPPSGNEAATEAPKVVVN
jgi:hypothetical protein